VTITTKSNRKARDERLLVVDDQAVNRDVAVRLLTRAGFHVSAVAGGSEAIEALNSEDYDLVLMDIHMPGMSGIEATAAIRALPAGRSRVPVVALTADTLGDLGDDFEKAGFSAFATKPINRAALLETVDQLLSEGKVVALEPEGPQNQTASLDPETLGTLKKAIGDAAFPALLDSFISEIHQQMDSLGPALESGRLEDVRFGAHNIKGCAGTVGAQRLREAAELLEHAGRDGDASAAASLLAELEGLSSEALEALAKYLKAL
jgi:CheY-like chemotaxis protein/HPt (histidine-containing phosphotransfer) domain-containing protein